MIYTVRYAHLKHLPPHDIGDVLSFGDVVGIMGNTGASYGAHLHIDCVRGLQKDPWKLIDMENYKVTPDFKQLNYFIDSDLFKGDYKITTHVASIPYQKSLGKLHLAYDVIPLKSSKNTIYYNRTRPGTVVAKGTHSGYGNYIHISFRG